jgi:hypothetical protein
VVPAWRTRDAELLATEVVAHLARETGARGVIAHASHQAVVDLAAKQRAAGARIFVECCPQYLLLLEDEVVDKGGLRKFTPPARARDKAELELMWRALAAGGIDYIATDHAPSTMQQKLIGTMGRPVWLAGHRHDAPRAPGWCCARADQLRASGQGLCGGPATIYKLRGKGNWRREPMRTWFWSIPPRTGMLWTRTSFPRRAGRRSAAGGFAAGQSLHTYAAT